MTSLGFENYAEALNIYLTRYRQATSQESSASHHFPPSPNITRKEDDVPPLLTPHQIEGTEPQNGGADASTITKNHITPLEKDENVYQDQANATRSGNNGGFKQDSKKEATSIVDSLLSEWTLLTEFR